jgi:glutathione S-transferase
VQALDSVGQPLGTALIESEEAGFFSVYRLYHAWTPNVIKVAIALEEMEMAYERIPVDISRGDQFKPEYLAINPNNKVPALLDLTPQVGEDPFPLFESGAILIYLAEKSGRFLPKTIPCGAAPSSSG